MSSQINSSEFNFEHFTIVDAAAPDPDKIRRIQHAYTYYKEVWYFMASFIGFLSICHFASLLYSFMQKRRPRRIGMRGAVSIRRLPAAIFDVSRAVMFRWTIPVGKNHTLSLVEVFLTAAYGTAIFTWALINSTSFKGVKYDPHYFANNAAHIVATQLPLVTALGMRNNIISLLTGLNYLHRMSGRLLALLIWVHAGGRINLGLTDDISLSHAYIRCGVLAASTLTVLSIVSIRPIRNLNYEYFLVIHFLLALIVLLAAYFHTNGFELGYLLLPSFGLWAFDRLLRIVRMVVLNFGYLRLHPSPELDAQIDVLSPHFIRLTMKRPNYVHWLPGQNAYITIPSVATIPFQGHPFTISTIDQPSLPSSKELDSIGSVTSNEELSLYKRMVFLINVRKGLTKLLLKAGSDNRRVQVVLDGPYSSPPLLWGYSSIVLIAGGSGVSFALPLLLSLVHQAKEGRASCNRIKFIWSIRSFEQVRGIWDILTGALEGVPPSVLVDIKIHVTASDETRSWSESSSAEVDSEAKSDSGSSVPKVYNHPLVQFNQGRADIRSVINAEIREEGASSISVNVCGPHSLKQAVRDVLKTPRFTDILKGGPTVSLHIETFGT